MNPLYKIHHGDALACLREMPDESVNTCVTSPPYFGLRDYGVDGQIGLEETPEAYIARLVDVFREVRRVLKKDGTLWVNIGDSYAANRGYQVPDGKAGYVGNSKSSSVPDGLKPKDLIGIPWMLAFALRADGWWLRQDIIWAKPNPMPESVTDRCTKAHEYIFLLSKSATYYYDHEAVQESTTSQPPRPRNKNSEGWYQGCGSTPCQSGERIWGASETRNRRSVWSVQSAPYPEAHFATYPPDLIKPCILAGCPEGGTVLDPFTGSGTTGFVALKFGRNFVGCELNADYIALAEKRIQKAVMPLFGESEA